MPPRTRRSAGPDADGADAVAMQMPEPPCACLRRASVRRAAICGACRRIAADGDAAETGIAANPAAQQAHFVAAPRDFHAAAPEVVVEPPPMPATPRAISEILVPHASARAAIEPELPPDHPLEPGTRPSQRMSSPSERIAASEEALGEIKATPKEQMSTSSFIAAARRAAQAAAAAPNNDKTARKKAVAKEKPRDNSKDTAKDKPADAKGAAGTGGSSITSKIRSLLVGASVVVIVLGTFKMAMTLLDTSSAPPMPAAEEPAQAPPAPAPATPSMISPAPLGRQSNNSSAPNMLDGGQITIQQGSGPALVTIPQAAAPAPINANDITGAIPTTPAAPKGGRSGQGLGVRSGAGAADRTDSGSNRWTRAA